MAGPCDRQPGFQTRWREGDNLPEIGFVLPDGELVADYTLELRVARPDGTILVKPAIDQGGSAGKFTWDDDDLQAGEGQRCEIHRIDGSGDEFTSPAFLISVDPRVGA